MVQYLQYITFTLVNSLSAVPLIVYISLAGEVYGMEHGRFIGNAMHFPTNQLGGHKMLLDKRGYGFSEVWDKRGSTEI